MSESWVWKDHILAVPSSLTWVVEVKDEPDLTLPAAWRAQEWVLGPRCPFQHRWALWCSGGCSKALAPDSREEVALGQSVAGAEEQPSCPLAAGGPPQARGHRGGTALRKRCPCFSRSETTASGADVSKPLISRAKIIAVHQTCLEEVAVPDRDVMHRLGYLWVWPGGAGWSGTRAVGWHGTAGNFGSSLLENGLSVCLSVPPFRLSACLSALIASQAANPLSEETFLKKKHLSSVVAAW